VGADVKVRAWVAAGAALYAAALAMLAPATLPDIVAARASDGRVRLAAAQGTLWSGRAEIALRDRATVVRAGTISWRLRGLTAAPPGLAFDVTASARPFVARVSLSRIELSEAALSLPARALGVAMPKLATIEPTGEVLLRVSRLAMTREGTTGDATIEWTNAGSALTKVAPLGAYEMRVTHTGTALEATLRTLKGPLELEGRGGWIAGGQPGFAAVARVTARESELKPLLGLIGVPRGDGTFELAL
jgi:general secretion pathway protein N